MKARHKRFLFIGAGLAGGALVMVLIYTALESKLFYFMSPTDIVQKQLKPNQAFRLGGMVVKGSLKKVDEGLTVQFTVTDKANNIDVRYTGILPDLFKEGSGIVAEGKINDSGIFVANEVLAKHDEDYMPPDVKKAMKRGEALAQESKQP